MPNNEYEFQIDLQGLIKLLARNLYAEADVFVREMLQNAHDSIQKKQTLQRDNTFQGRIQVKIDREAATITIGDNGVGMTEQEVREHLATIGRSGTAEFRQRENVVELIGQFGIGLLSAFIVADKVVIETQSYQLEYPTLRWESDGGKTFSLQSIGKREIGTTVTLHISENYRDMLMKNKLQEAVRKYADFLPSGIYLNDDEDPTNAINAPWHKHYTNAKEDLRNVKSFMHFREHPDFLPSGTNLNDDDEELRDLKSFVRNRFKDLALAIIPINIGEPYPVQGVMYVSENRSLVTGMVDIYQKRMFVMEANRDVLPVWAKFIRGVIDSPALTLTAARDAVQMESVLTVRKLLEEEIIRQLTHLAETESSKFEKICEWHHTHLKGVAARDETFFKSIAELLSFETNEGAMNLKTYFAKIKEKSQSELLYFDESGFATQFYMLCDAQGLLVINASNPLEDEFLERYGRLHPDITLRQLNIGESPKIFISLDSHEGSKYESLKKVFKQILPERSSVKAVRFKPNSIPALTVHSEEARRVKKLEQTARDVLTPEEIRQSISEILQNQPSIPFTLYLNVDNSIIQKLAVSPTEETRVAYQAIFANAAMLSGQMNNPKNAEEAFKDFSKLIDQMLSLIETVQEVNKQTDEQQEQIKKLKEQIIELNKEIEQPVLPPINGKISQTEHVSCFFAMPFRTEYDPVLEAVKRVLEDRPYGWQVIRADDQHLPGGIDISRNVQLHIDRSHCYLAEISDASPNVYLEIGRISHYQPERPLMYLYDKNTEKPIPADLLGHLYFPYNWNLDNPNVDDLTEQLKREFDLRRDELLKLRIGKKTYLSSTLLIQHDFAESLVERICKQYKNVEDFIETSSTDIIRDIHVERARGSIKDIQDFLKSHFGIL
jgi:molecular chaperone HtpG